MRIDIVLPWPPSVNHYFVHTRRGAFLSPAARAYRLLVCAAARDANAPELVGDVRLDIMAAAPDNRRRDLDNVLKGLLDAIQHAGIYADDFQVSDLRIRRAGVVPGGSLAVMIQGTAKK